MWINNFLTISGLKQQSFIFFHVPELGWGSAGLDSVWLTLAPGCGFASVAPHSSHSCWTSGLFRACSHGNGGNRRGKVWLHMYACTHTHVSSLCLHMSAKITFAKGMNMDRPSIHEAENVLSPWVGRKELQAHVARLWMGQEWRISNGIATCYTWAVGHLERSTV